MTNFTYFNYTENKIYGHFLYRTIFTLISGFELAMILISFSIFC